MRIGLIADTHDLVRPEALAALSGSDHIIHAGDVCGPAVIEALSKIAPVSSVRGNRDKSPWGDTLPWTLTPDFAGVRVHVIHILTTLTIDPAAEGIQFVVSGHSHRAATRERQGVLYVNPGSAGARRFKLPVSLARLTIKDGQFDVEFVNLDPTVPLLVPTTVG